MRRWWRSGRPDEGAAPAVIGPDADPPQAAGSVPGGRLSITFHRPEGDFWAPVAADVRPSLKVDRAKVAVGGWEETVTVPLAVGRHRVEAATLPLGEIRWGIAGLRVDVADGDELFFEYFAPEVAGRPGRLTPIAPPT